jgi:acetylornithine/N-succinyldiaminopimelate aminotransferase
VTNHNEDNTVDTSTYNRRLMDNLVRLPLVASTASGSTIQAKIEGASVTSMLDYWGDEGVCSLGYNSHEYMNAMLTFLGSGNPQRLPDIYPHEKRWEAAEVLCAKSGMDRCFFANSGTEANESAIKLARKHWWDLEGGDKGNGCAPYRNIILTVQGNFHGRTGYAMAASDFRVSPYHRSGFGPCPTGFGVIDADVGEDGEYKFVQSCQDGIELQYDSLEEPDWSRVAAIILAPVLGNNVVTTYPPKFWDALANIRAQHGVLLIYDDVQAGNGRAGQYATWQDPSCGVKPDIMTLAKGIAMGLPMSVCLASERIAKAFTPGVHFNTFGGGLLQCHLAIEFYKWLDTHLPAVRAKGAMIRSAFAEANWIAQHDGMGMLNAFTPDYESNGYDGFEFTRVARTLGLSIVTHRRHGAIRFTPPLNTPIDEIKKALTILDATHSMLMSTK